LKEPLKKEDCSLVNTKWYKSVTVVLASIGFLAQTALATGFYIATNGSDTNPGIK
jgi:hypothetical protein